MLDVISIGSATEDVFVHIPKKFDGNRFTLKPGAKVDIERMDTHTGGGATNTGVAFARLGLKAGIMSAIGNDEGGSAIWKKMKKEGVDTRFLVQTKGDTQYSVILTGFGKDRVILCYMCADTKLDKAKMSVEKARAKWFYISSLHENPSFLKKIAAHAEKTGAKIAFNPGEKELRLGIAGFKRVFGKIDVLLLNKEEALRLTGNADVHRNLKKLVGTAEIAVITAGSGGAYAANGTMAYHAKSYPNIRPLDVTGAGDAFGSGFVSAIIKGRGIEAGLRAGTMNANSVITHLGTKNVLLSEKGMGKFEKRHGKVKITREKL